MAKNNEQPPIRCSFCGKRENQTSRLIAGPGVYICSDCVQACSDLLREEYDLDTPEALKAPEHLPTPMEMKSFMDRYIISGRICHRAGYGEGRPVRGGVQPL